MKNWMLCCLLVCGALDTSAMAQQAQTATPISAKSARDGTQELYDAVNAAFKADQELQIDFTEAVQRQFIHNSFIGGVLKTAVRPVYASDASFVPSEQVILNAVQRNNYREPQIQMLRAARSQAQFDRFESEFSIESDDLRRAAARGKTQEVLSGLALGLSVWLVAVFWLSWRLVSTKPSTMLSIGVPAALTILSMLLLSNRAVLVFALATPLVVAVMVGVSRLVKRLFVSSESLQWPAIEVNAGSRTTGSSS